ncbi:MAG: malonyl-CoA synthase [Cereibacter sphaeroides]|uniref:Malonyl-CoA synthase n=1 Tax=Cereibacter sphaeroides TaxID=1063 RepID=A0A2W5TLM6_CERSP|nr:MAG: malonyl-CoA synthase [Cereibacter sphaeroides]
MANILYDALFASLAGRQSPLLIMADGTTISGDAFLRMVAQQANALSAAGLGTGDRIAMQVSKTPQALATYGAAVALGAVFLPLNPAYTANEIDYFLGDATPRIFVCDGAREAQMAPIAARNAATLLTMNADGSGGLPDRAATAADSITPVDRASDDLAALLYTSGTTGRSKGAMLSQGNLLSNAAALGGLWRFTDRDVLLHALPIFHTHGLFVASNVTLLTGGAMIWLPGFDLDAMLRLMPQATAMMGVPTFYTRLLDDPRLTRDLTSHIRLFVSGSAPLLAETHLGFEERTGHRILERYGMTETNMNTSNPYEGERRAGTVGFPLPGVEVQLTENALEVAPGEVGLIEVRGPNVFQGYWQMPEKTAEELRPDGFFLTGDLGRIDADGYLHIVGRQKDLIISGGFNVYPKEVELLLDEVPGVAESAVIGLPHPDFGEAVFAVLVSAKGATLEPDHALAAIRSRLARFKQPKAAVVVTDLPRNTMGKVQKNLLREAYTEWFSPKVPRS